MERSGLSESAGRDSSLFDYCQLVSGDLADEFTAMPTKKRAQRFAEFKASWLQAA